MSTLPEVGSRIQIFGTGCDGCGHFAGIFRVLAVEDRAATALVVDTDVVQCEGDLEEHHFGPMKVEWNRRMQRWEADCSGRHLIVELAGRFHGPPVGEARARIPAH